MTCFTQRRVMPKFSAFKGWSLGSSRLILSQKSLERKSPVHLPPPDSCPTVLELLIHPHQGVRCEISHSSQSLLSILLYLFITLCLQPYLRGDSSWPSSVCPKRWGSPAQPCHLVHTSSRGSGLASPGEASPAPLRSDLISLAP